MENKICLKWIKRHTQIESEEIDKDIPCKWKLKEIELTVLISDQKNFNRQNVGVKKGEMCHME